MCIRENKKTKTGAGENLGGGKTGNAKREIGKSGNPESARAGNPEIRKVGSGNLRSGRGENPGIPARFFWKKKSSWDPFFTFSAIRMQKRC